MWLYLDEDEEDDESSRDSGGSTDKRKAVARERISYSFIPRSGCLKCTLRARDFMLLSAFFARIDVDLIVNDYCLLYIKCFTLSKKYIDAEND
mmetsp:Transcript_4934/g.7249  ORF Transcript_4934/g.7249 Transcript_4934/m.7249 type:complete len:93 (+) Transcript_4934:1333-1611(+)